MKMQEAAEICQSIKFILDKEDYSEEVEEALDMAIKALQHLSLPRIIIGQGEKEPKCEDCKWNTWDNNCMVEYRGCRFEPKRESDEE